MHLLALICGIVLLEKAFTLRCYDCTPESPTGCTDSATDCFLQGQKCGALRIRSYAGGITAADINMKSCFLPEQCIDGSVNFGVSRTVITSRCCDTDLCNTEDAPAGPSKGTPNGKKCYTCNGLKCTSTVDCEGDEDHCISSSVKLGEDSVTMKGCASKLLCSNPAQMAGSIGGEISCCEGNLCNSVSRTGAGLLLLLSLLLASVVLS